MQKWVFLIIITLFFSGCLESTLSSNEIQWCIEGTQAGISRIPKCDTAASCFAAWEKKEEKISYEFLQVGETILLSEKSLGEGWSLLNQAHNTLEKINQSCGSYKVDGLVNQAIKAGTELKQGLKNAELAQEKGKEALIQSIEKASKMDLEKIPNTSAFEEYTKALTLLQELGSKENNTKTGQQNQKNIEYFSQIETALSGNGNGPYTIQTKNAFGFYENLLKNKNTTIYSSTKLFFPVWESMLSAWTNNYDIEKGLTVLGSIKGNEVINHIETMLEPDNGILPNTIKQINKLEKSLEELDKTENSRMNELVKKTDILKQKSKEKKEVFLKYQKILEIINDWLTLNGLSEISIGEDFVEKQIENQEEKIKYLQQGKWNKTITMGERIKQLENIENEIANQETMINEIEEQTAKGLKVCQQMSEDVFSGKKVQIKTFEDCESMIQQAKAEKNQSLEDLEKVGLNECINANAVLTEALEIEQKTSEWYLFEYGNGALGACLSEQQNLKKIYDDEETSIHIGILQKKINEYVKAFSTGMVYHELKDNEGKASSLIEKGKALSKDSVFPKKEHGKKIEELNAFLESMISFTDEVMESAAKNIKWKLAENLTVNSNQVKNVNVAGKINNPFHTTIYHDTFIFPEIPEEINISKINGNPIEDSKLIVIDTPLLPKEGFFIEGNGTIEIVQQKNNIDNVEIIGTKGKIQETITLSSSFYPVSVKLDLPEEISYSDYFTLETKKEKKTWVNSIPHELIIDVTDGIEQVKVEYLSNQIVSISKKIVSNTTEWNENILVYEIKVKNNIDKEIKVSISTGILIYPGNKNGIFITDDSGKSITPILNELIGIVIPPVIFYGNGEQTFFIKIVSPENILQWKVLAQTLLNNLEELKNSENDEIRGEANLLYKKINELMKGENSEEYEVKLPGFSAEVQLLLEKEKNYEKALSELEITIEDLEKKIPTVYNNNEKIIEMVGEVKKFINLKKITEAQSAITQIENELTSIGDAKNTSISPETTINSIQETLAKTKEVQIIIENWDNILGISCSKLSEVGYSCPIDEKTKTGLLTEIKGSVKELEKIITLWEKAIEKNTTLTNFDEIEIKINEIKEKNLEKEQLFNDGKNNLKETSEGLLQEAEKLERTNSNEEVQNAISKGRNAIIAQEYGKGIYIIKTVIDFVKGNQNWLDGVTIPPAGWGVVLIGFIFAGVFVHKKIRKKEDSKVVFKKIPKNYQNLESLE